MILVIRFGFIVLLFACIIAIPVFLIKLMEMEMKKKEKKNIKEKEQRKTQSPMAPKVVFPSVDPYQGATAKVKELFISIEAKQKTLKEEKNWLSLEAIHDLTETIPKDFQNYKELYGNIKDKKSVEANVITALEILLKDLESYEKEVEEKKKAALHRQEYIMETREKNHL